ncbi:hypothetical protein [Sorangium sp. So ce1182]|uniref:hypothetical protein n=1 Tax=Sorangium sp. So ce1182 TaxID=3133334 RepID=UPI003F60C6FB
MQAFLAEDRAMLELLSFERRRSLATDTSLVPRLPGGRTRHSLTTVRRGLRLGSEQ